MRMVSKIEVIPLMEDDAAALSYERTPCVYAQVFKQLQPTVHGFCWRDSFEGTALAGGRVGCPAILVAGRYGELYFIYGYLSFFQSVAPLGFHGVVVRDLSVDRSSASEILGTTMILRLITGIPCWVAAVGGLGIWYGFSPEEILLCALAGGSLIFQAFDTIHLWFQSRSQSKRTIIPKFISYMCVTALKVTLLMTSAPALRVRAHSNN